MCEISDQIKLCTCKTENFDKLKYYWVLSRRDDDLLIVGEFIPPLKLEKEIDTLNREKLEALLNDDNCFDVDLSLKDDDTLTLYFNSLNHEGDKGYIAYKFIFNNVKWHNIDFDPNDTNFITLDNGSIKNPFKKG